MGNPEKETGKLGHEGRGEGKPGRRPNPNNVAKKLGKLGVQGSQEK